MDFIGSPLSLRYLLNMAYNRSMGGKIDFDADEATLEGAENLYRGDFDNLLKESEISHVSSIRVHSLKINRVLDVVFDFKNAIKAFINPRIKHYQLPHCFHFKRHRSGKCIMVYKINCNDKV
jgi:hypothetical protein